MSKSHVAPPKEKDTSTLITNKTPKTSTGKQASKSPHRLSSGLASTGIPTENKRALDSAGAPAGREIASKEAKTKNKDDNDKKDKTVEKQKNTEILRAAEKKAWLYIGRTSTATTTEVMKTYITQKLNTSITSQ